MKLSSCSVCGNQKQQRQTRSIHTGPRGKQIMVWEPYCPYCEWKGTTGPGAQLRQLIKEHNHEHQTGRNQAT